MARLRKRQPEAPSTCPVCGEDVSRGALACPECGADHRSGWREGATDYDGIDLPGQFDYDEFVRDEFGSSPRPRAIGQLWWFTAIALLFITLLYCYLAR